MALRKKKLKEGTQYGLPPLIEGTAEGIVIWRSLEGIDNECLGYFLSCHLIIEHYTDKFLKDLHRELDWDSARLTFTQKVTLISNLDMLETNCVPAIKHLNSLRNKLSHEIEFKIDTENLIPLRTFLTSSSKDNADIPSDVKGVLHLFTYRVCSWFAGWLSHSAYLTNQSPRNQNALRVQDKKS